MTALLTTKKKKKKDLFSKPFQIILEYLLQSTVQRRIVKVPVGRRIIKFTFLVGTFLRVQQQVYTRILLRTCEEVHSICGPNKKEFTVIVFKCEVVTDGLSNLYPWENSQAFLKPTILIGICMLPFPSPVLALLLQLSFASQYL